MMRTVLVALLIAPSVLLLTAQQPDPGPVTARGEWTADSRQWWSNDDGPRVQLNLRSDGVQNWGFGVPVRELVGLPAAAAAGDCH